MAETWPVAVGVGREEAWPATAVQGGATRPVGARWHAQREVRPVLAEPSEAAPCEDWLAGVPVQWCPRAGAGLDGGETTVHLW